MKLFASTTCLLLLAAAAPVNSLAQQVGPLAARSPYWSGAFSSAGVFAGPMVITNQNVDSPWGLAFGAKVRTSMVLTLFDLELSYIHSMASPHLDRTPLDLDSDSLGVSLGVHPLFFVTLLGYELGPLLAQATFQAGLSAEFNRYEWADTSLSETPALGMHLGAILDIPVDDLQDGGSFWIGVQYRYNRVETELDLLASDESGLRQHFLFIRLVYRVNGYLI